MKSSWGASCSSNHKQCLLKLVVVLLLTGLTFRFFYQSLRFDPNFGNLSGGIYDENQRTKNSETLPHVNISGEAPREPETPPAHVNALVEATKELSPPPQPVDEDTVEISSAKESSPPPRPVDDDDVQISSPNLEFMPPPPYGVDKDLSNAQTSKNEIPPPQDENDESTLNGTQSDEITTPDETKEGQSEEVCDIFVGDWVPNPSGPTYTNSSCFVIEGNQNCMKNGRPDSGYLYWRWKPRNCELPPFDAQEFLELMKNKAFAVIGDSISRNHAQSLLCMLSSAEQPVEVYHDERYKTKRWVFPSYNFSVSNIWSPYLLQASIFEDDNGVASAVTRLHFDKLDSGWTDKYESLDYMIISTGQWFLKAGIFYENDTEVGCHSCDEKKNLTETGFAYAYQKALHKVLDFISESNHSGTIFFRMSIPDHFENGDWHNGGNCPKQSPLKSGEIEIKDVQHYLRDVEIEEFGKASAKAAANGVNLQLLDFTNVLLTRPDGHPGAYREFHPFSDGKNTTVRDCLHWCLPGPIDYLNDIIMKLIVNSSQRR